MMSWVQWWSASDPLADIRLPVADGIAPRHAVLEWTPVGVLVRVLDSASTVSVHGKPVVRALLRAGQQLSVGSTAIIVEAYTERAPGQGVETGDTGDTIDLIARATATTPSVCSVSCDECGLVRAITLAPEFAKLPWLCEACASRRTSGPTMARIGDHDLLRPLGEGIMGVVYEGRHRFSGCRSAVKVIRDSLLDEPALRRRFVREQQAAALVAHERVVRCLGFGTQGERPYLIGEYMGGGEASQLLAPNMDVGLVLNIAIDVFRGLAVIHEAGYVHRDIKPQNILLQHQAGRVQAKIGDLGMIGYLQRIGVTSLTADGAVGGTLLYMSPEQLLDFKRVDRSADLYSAGACLYHMLTGQLPLTLPASAFDETDLLMSIAEQPRVAVRSLRPQLSLPLAQLIDTLVSLDEDPRAHMNAGDIAEILSDIRPS